MTTVKVVKTKSFSIYFNGLIIEFNGKSAWKRRSDASLVRNNFLRRLFDDARFASNFETIEQLSHNFEMFFHSGATFLKVPKSNYAITVFSQDGWSVCHFCKKFFEVR